MSLWDFDENRGEKQRQVIGKITDLGSDWPDLESCFSINCLPLIILLTF